MKTTDKILGASRVGSSVAVAILLAACRSSSPGAAYDDSRVAPEPVSTTETTGAVLEHAEEVNAAAIEDWSKVPPPANAPAQTDLPPVTTNPSAPTPTQTGTPTPNGPIAQPPLPTPPRSASEAAERNEPMREDPSAPRPVFTPGLPGAGGAAPTTPAPVQPTAPAETRDPLRGR